MAAEGCTYLPANASRDCGAERRPCAEAAAMSEETRSLCIAIAQSVLWSAVSESDLIFLIAIKKICFQGTRSTTSTTTTSTTSSRVGTRTSAQRERKERDREREREKNERAPKIATEWYPLTP